MKAALPAYVLGLALLGCSPAMAAQAGEWGLESLPHIEALEDLGPRVAGSVNERLASAYIQSALRESGYDPEIQPFSLARRGAGEAQSANVIARKAGTSGREIIVGAHYDSETLGFGADDNASGVALMLAVAADLAGTTIPYTVRFVAFGAEEGGLRGSRHFVSVMDEAEVANTVAMINLDSLGAGDIAYVYGNDGEGGVIRDWILREASREGLDLGTQAGDNPEFPFGTTCDCSDHAPFEARGIQYVYFESTNWNLGELDGYTQVDVRFGDRGHIWHTPYDTLEYLEENFPGRMAERLDLFGHALRKILTEYRE